MDKAKAFLYSAIVIPILMIIITFFCARYYSVRLEPKQDFIYGLLKFSDGYVCEERLKTTLFPKLYPDKYPNSKYKNPSCSDAMLYRYSFKSNTSTQLTISQAQSLAGQLSRTSAEGFTVQQYCDFGTPLGWWGDLNGYGVCLRKQNYREKLELQTLRGDDLKYDYFIFLGWLIDKQG